MWHYGPPRSSHIKVLILKKRHKEPESHQKSTCLIEINASPFYFSYKISNCFALKELSLKTRHSRIVTLFRAPEILTS